MLSSSSDVFFFACRQRCKVHKERPKEVMVNVFCKNTQLGVGKSRHVFNPGDREIPKIPNFSPGNPREPNISINLISFFQQSLQELEKLDLSDPDYVPHTGAERNLTSSKLNRSLLGLFELPMVQGFQNGIWLNKIFPSGGDSDLHFLGQ